MHAAVIRGVVTENQTGKPLLRVVVTLKPLSGTAGASQSVRTNAAGIFDFPPVPGGAYLVSAARRNFFTIQYGQKDWRAAGAPVVIDDTASVFLPIRLPRLGVITGRVVDENDVGLPNHDVVVFRNTQPPQLAGKASADERGIYRLFDLDPGSYLVKTVAREYDEGSYVPTFSKSTLKVEEARPVEVLLDQEANNIDVQPFMGKLYKISGMVHPGAMITEGDAAGQPVSVKLTFASDMGRETTSTSGGFRFPPMPPGDYELYAEGPGDGSGRCPAVGGYLPFSIKDKDRTDLDFAVPCIRESSIQLLDSRGGSLDPSKAKVYVRRKDMAGTGEARELPLSGSRFYMRVLLAPGRWEFLAVPVAGYCVVQFGYTRSRSEGVEPSRPDGWNEAQIGTNFATPLRFVFSGNPGKLHGLVSGLAREPVSGAPVFLEPYDGNGRKRQGELRTVFTDARGQYRFSDLPPGTYRVLSTFEFQSPDAAVMEMAGAKQIAIALGEDLPQDLDLSVIR